MKLRVLPLVPFAVVAALLAALAVADPAWHRWVVRIEIEGVKLLALGGCVAAALAFDRGDYLRRAWYLSGSCYAFLLLRDVLLGSWTPWAPGPTLAGVSTDVLESVLVLLANAGAVAGTFMLARAWQVAGLELTVGATRRRLLFVAALVLATGVIGGNLVADARAFAGGQQKALVSLVSDAGDILSLALVVPVLLTALALRGGLLLWPWGLLTASMIGWLLYDATSSFGHVVGAGAGIHVTGEVFRSFACTFAFAAGLAQRTVVLHPPAGAAAGAAAATRDVGGSAG